MKRAAFALALLPVIAAAAADKKIDTQPFRK